MAIVVFASILYASPKASSTIVWILIACIGFMLYAMPAVLEGFADDANAKKARVNAPRTKTTPANAPLVKAAPANAPIKKAAPANTPIKKAAPTNTHIKKAPPAKAASANVAENAADYDMLVGKLNEIIKPQNSIAFLTPELGEKTAVGLTELPKEHDTTRSMPEDAEMVPVKSKALEQGQSFHSTLPSKVNTHSTPPVKCPDLDDYVRKDKVARDYIRRKDMPDMRDYVRRKDIPPMPDMRDFVRKQDIPPHPNMRDYIRKDSIPCWGCKLK